MEYIWLEQHEFFSFQEKLISSIKNQVEMKLQNKATCNSLTLYFVEKNPVGY